MQLAEHRYAFLFTFAFKLLVVPTMRQRNKSDKLLVWVPEHGWIFHHTSESTYLEVLRLIGGERLSKVALEISHMPVFTKEPYPQFAKYMKSIGHGDRKSVV